MLCSLATCECKLKQPQPRPSCCRTAEQLSCHRIKGNYPLASAAGMARFTFTRHRLHCVIVRQHEWAKCYYGQNRFGGARKSRFRSDSISSKNRDFRFRIEYRSNTSNWSLHLLFFNLSAIHCCILMNILVCDVWRCRMMTVRMVRSKIQAARNRLFDRFVGSSCVVIARGAWAVASFILESMTKVSCLYFFSLKS